MLLRIQKDESLRSYAERNRFLPGTNFEINTSKTLSQCHLDGSAVRKIANILGWEGCHGINKLLHEHTKSPPRYVFKSKFDFSYSGFDYLDSHYFDSLTGHRPYCPLCVKEDKIKMGYSYWRRIHNDVSVCPKHFASIHVVICSVCTTICRTVAALTPQSMAALGERLLLAGSFRSLLICSRCF